MTEQIDELTGDDGLVEMEAEQRFAKAVGLDASQRWLPETRRQIGRLLLESDDLRANLVRAVADRDRALESLAAVKALTVCQAAKIDRLQHLTNEQAATIARLTDHLETTLRRLDEVIGLESPADGGCGPDVQRQLDEQLSRSPTASGPAREIEQAREFDT